MSRLSIGVFIRSCEYLNSKDAALIDTFLIAANKQIPIYYQYCQSKKPNAHTPESDRIGYATNFRCANNNMVCDVTLVEGNPLSWHFNDVIDNYTVNVKQVSERLEFELTKLLVYNREFKNKRDSEVVSDIITDVVSEDTEFEEDE